MFAALEVFYEGLCITGELRITAPTGVAASNVGSSTVHAGFGLMS